MKNVLIIGATSAIASATARLLAPSGSRFYLLGRSSDRLITLSNDLLVRGANSVEYSPFEAIDLDTHESCVNAAFSHFGTVDIVLVCHGSLPDQEACEVDRTLALKEMNINGLSVISVLTTIANRIEAQRGASIAVITSVAGDRGRQSNYVYGASKAMVSTFIEGLRNRLHTKGISVIDIKPGFVDTPMTAAFDKGMLWTQPDRVAKDIVKAINSKKNTVYTPGFWRLIMLVIRNIPESIFKRLSL